MDRVFANFHMDDDFYVMLFIFLLITMLISTVIVIFLTKIQTLSTILEKAKAIDKAKEKRLAFLNMAWNDEKIENIKLKEELKYLKGSREKFINAEKIVNKLQEQIIEQEKEHVDELYEKKTLYDKLKIHYRLMIEQLEKAEEELFVVKRLNEELKEKFSILYSKNRKLEIKFLEQNRGKLKDEFTEFTSKFFEGNSKDFRKVHYSDK